MLFVSATDLDQQAVGGLYPFLFLFSCYPDSLRTHLLHAVYFDLKKKFQI